MGASRIDCETNQTRVSGWQEMLVKFVSSISKRFYEGITGDGTWIFKFEPQFKRQSSVWVIENEEQPKKSPAAEEHRQKNYGHIFSESGHTASVSL